MKADQIVSMSLPMQASLLDGSTVDLVAGGWLKMITPELRDTYL